MRYTKVEECKKNVIKKNANKRGIAHAHNSHEEIRINFTSRHLIKIKVF